MGYWHRDGRIVKCLTYFKSDIVMSVPCIIFSEKLNISWNLDKLILFMSISFGLGIRKLYLIHREVSLKVN